MNLFEIDAEILNCVDVETGEIFDIDKFEELEMTRDAKIENICLWIKNLKAEAEALKAEKDAFYARQKAAENKMESLKQYISTYLEGSPFKSTKVQVSFRKSEVLDIEEGAAIPDEYLKFKEPDVDKTALKKAVKEGLSLVGVSVIERQNIQIK
jgi:hypothetical protein